MTEDETKLSEAIMREIPQLGFCIIDFNVIWRGKGGHVGAHVKHGSAEQGFVYQTNAPASDIVESIRNWIENKEVG